ncbi:hypothetical protein EDE15_0103 [Edaphobacter aggregans]|uniref:DUF4239 domain-containing protein n=1 Tax=Edaphobacter aggregans TaxID=570835 RepID=A0A428MCM7_9BACT|nr:DUF4239 domain-containing protein [Edaphobacter aggregans]RSL14648.1 hypothetical protein EDE15_0103 [Edaphobacter aggregans]
MSLSPIDALPLFFAMLLLIELGRRLHARSPHQKSNSAIEGAIFGLFGLLLAFTFSGAIARYDTHRKLVIEEVNDIGTAYLRLDLLPRELQPEFRDKFRDYVTSRLDRFDSPTNMPVSEETVRLQKIIWAKAIAATTTSDGHSEGGRLLLPALNQMFEITITRKNAFDMHPPLIVYLLLFALSCGCALFAGYNMTDPHRNLLHIIAFAAVFSLTIYATLEIEYPRKGLIRLSNTDQAFIDLRNSM